MSNQKPRTIEEQMCSRCHKQGRAKLQIFLGVYIWAKTGRSPNKNIVQDIVQQMLRAKAGRSYKYFWEFIFEQGRREAVTGTSSKILCSKCYEQGRCKVTNIFGSLHLSNDGAKPQQEYSPRQRLGYGCKNKLARCKRKRKKESIPIQQQNCM